MGACFVTATTVNRQAILGEVREAETQLSSG
jgi:hypothetical protein